MIKSPIIILGMHRSGTTLVAEMLQKSGMYLGNKLDVNLEATYFQKINKWLLSMAGASWDNPDTCHLIFQNDDLLEDILDRIEKHFDQIYAREYFGLKYLIMWKLHHSLPIPWGWKDPRNTLTLPIHLCRFPDAKIIHIYRHGVDVAESLKVREDRIMAAGQNRNMGAAKRMMAMTIPVIRGGVQSSVICQDRQRAFDLWVKYMDRAAEYKTKYADKFLSIRYETFLEDPVSHLKALIDFCGTYLSDEDEKKILSSLQKSRAFVHRKNPILMEFAQKNKDQLERYGY